MLRIRIDAMSLVLGVVIALGLWILWRFVEATFSVLVLFVVALILATSLAPLIGRLRGISIPPGEWQLPKAIAAIAVYLVAIALIAGLLYAVTRPLLHELVTLSSALSNQVQQPASAVANLLGSLGLPSSAVPSPSQIQAQLKGLPAAVLAGLGSAATRLATLVVDGFVVFALSFFLVVESETILGFWLRLFPSGQRDRVRKVTTTMGSRMGDWLLGRATASAIVGVLCGLTVLLLGLPFPILIGVVSGVLDLVPLVGPTVMIPVVFALGLPHSTLTAVIAAVVFFAIAQLDANVLTPLIMGRAVQLSPVVILVAVPLGATLYGVVGALIAVPVAAALKVMLADVVLPWLHEREAEAERRRRESNAQPQRTWDEAA